MLITQRAHRDIPRPGKLAGRADVAKVPSREPEGLDQPVIAQVFYDVRSVVFCHDATMTNYLSWVKTQDSPYDNFAGTGILPGMDLDEKPFGDIAARIRWHRELEGLTQNAYAQRIGVKRAALNNWESGDYRLSLDGALALRKTYGLSLDFMYEGNDDALPMTLRQAWRDRP